MLKEMSLAACIGLAATLAFAAGPARAQSTPAEGPAPQPPQAETASPTPADTAAPGAAAPAAAAAEPETPAPAEAAAAAEAPAPSGVETPAPSESTAAAETPPPSGAGAAVETPAPSEAEAAVETPAPSEAEAAVETPAPSGAEAAVETPAPSGAEAAVETPAPSEAAAAAETPAPSESTADAEMPAPSEAAAAEAPAGAEAVAPADKDDTTATADTAAPAEAEAEAETTATDDAAATANATTPAPAGTKTPAAAEGTAPVPATAAAQPVVEADPVVAEVRRQLEASDPADTTDEEREALTAFYAERHAPGWVAAGEGLTERARHAMAEIAGADAWGLDAEDFALPVLAPDNLTPAALAAAEIKLGAAVLKYARYARGGRLKPSQVSRNFDQKLSLRGPKVVLETVSGLDTPGSYLRSLHPKHPQFELLRQALIRVRAEAAAPQDESAVKLPGGPLLKLGVEHPHVALLRQRLELPAMPAEAEPATLKAEDAPEKKGAGTGAAGNPHLYDEAVEAAVVAYQRKNGMRPDGIVGPRTRASLNDEGDPELFGTLEERLIVNMERWRWMPEDMGELHVWNNVPEYQTRVVKNGRTIHQAKIIVGKLETQTTIFSENMRYIIFGPEWGVPNSIKVKEILPYLRPTYETDFFGFMNGGYTDTRVLERHNLRVSYRGRPVDASRIDWSEVDIRKYNFIQPPGPDNVLGKVKFRFPNKHAIYMHDTPQKHLFKRNVRMFSHGCMRVYDPGRLAAVLLEEDKGWSAARVRGMMDRGGNNHVTLTEEVPVHTAYFTTVVDEDGKVRSFADIYGHDRRVARALGGRALPPEPRSIDASPTVQRDVRQARGEARREERRRRQQMTQQELFSGLFGN